MRDMEHSARDTAGCSSCLEAAVRLRPGVGRCDAVAEGVEHAGGDVFAGAAGVVE